MKPTLSAAVRDDNPYSRLMALQRMGVVENYEAIRTKSVAIIGTGGVGSVAAEMLTRCGIGKLLLFDYDTVELANMNRLFFRPEQRGQLKVVAARDTLTSINPDVEVCPCGYNVTLVDRYNQFLSDLVNGGVAPSTSVDLLLCCVDNYQARASVNQACLELNLSWMESGVAENAVSGHIQLMLPGITPCYECAPPLVVATGMAEPKRDGVCAASLPTTMGIIAGFLAQSALKLLLKFGEVREYVGYDAMHDHFPSIALRPNTECTNRTCVARQGAYQTKLAEVGPAAHPLYAMNTAATAAKKPIAHKSNEWGIEVASKPEARHDDAATTSRVVERYGRPAQKGPDEGEQFVDPSEGDSLQDLMAKLKATQS